MPELTTIIDITRRHPRDDFFLENKSLRLEIIKYLMQACRKLQSGIRVELHADQILPCEDNLADKTAKTRCPANKNHKKAFLKTAASSENGSHPDFLYIAPLRGIVTEKRIRELLKRAISPGFYISTISLTANRHPAWQLQGNKTNCGSQIFSRRPMRHIGARKDMPGHLKPYLPHPNEIRGSQYLPEIEETDFALMLLKRGPRYLKKEYLLHTENDLTDAPLAFRLPVFNMDESVECAGV